MIPARGRSLVKIMTATQASLLVAEVPPRSLDEVSPVSLVDVLLEAALVAEADFLWIEPVPGSEQRYAVSKQTVKQDKSADQVDSNAVFLAAPSELELVGTELAELK